MFKYTTPWQVLCATLEPRVQVRVGALVVLVAPLHSQPAARGSGEEEEDGRAVKCWVERDAGVMLRAQLMGMWQWESCYPKGAVLGYGPMGTTTAWLQVCALVGVPWISLHTGGSTDIRSCLGSRGISGTCAQLAELPQGCAHTAVPTAGCGAPQPLAWTLSQPHSKTGTAFSPGSTELQVAVPPTPSAW